MLIKQNMELIARYLISFFVASLIIFYPNLPLQAQEKDSGCDLIIDVETRLVDARQLAQDVPPGAILCLAAGQRDALTLRNLQGSAAAPIIIQNAQGQVIIRSSNTHGILIQNSQHIHLSGQGDPDITYGIKISESLGNGLRIGKKSQYFEVDYLEISGVPKEGIQAQTKVTCSDASDNDYDYDGDGHIQGDLDDVLNRDNFVQDGSIIHDNFIHDVGTEGIYLGNVFYLSGKRLDCAQGRERVMPPVLQGVEIYRNQIYRSGWEGIQVSSAIADCQIYHNTIIEDSTDNDLNQQAGITNGLGSSCDIFGNLIQNGGGPGMYIFGNGGNIIYDNLIINPGRHQNYKSSGINVRNGGTENGSIYLENNLIFNAPRFGISWNRTQGVDNQARANLIIGLGDLGADEASPYIHISPYANVDLKNNLSAASLTALSSQDETSLFNPLLLHLLQNQLLGAESDLE